MTLLVEDIVKETIEKFNKLATIKSKPLDTAALTEKIKTIFRDAFQQIENKEDKKSLYKKLSRKLHPDQINKNKKLAAYLTTTGLINLPMSILGEIYTEQSWISQLLTNPFDTIVELLKSISQSTYTHLNRYPIIIKELMLLIFFVANTILFVGTLVTLVPVLMLFLIARNISLLENPLLNLVTQNKYDEAINEGDVKIDGARDYLSDQKMKTEDLSDNEVLRAYRDYKLAPLIEEIKIRLLLRLRNDYAALGIDATNMNDEALQEHNEHNKVVLNLIAPLQMTGEDLLQYDYNEAIAQGHAAETPDQIIERELNATETEKKQSNNQRITHIGIVFNAFKKTLERPWPPGVAGIMGSFLVRIPQFILAFVFLPAAIVIELTKFTVGPFLGSIIIGVGLTAILVTDFLLTAPLLGLDGLNYLFFDQQDEDELEDQQTADLESEPNDASTTMHRKLGVKSNNKPPASYQHQTHSSGNRLFKPIESLDTTVETTAASKSPSPTGADDYLD